MDIEFPEPGVALNSGPVTEPTPAATVILARGGSERLEVLLVRRNPAAGLLSGVWVFPGGSVDPADRALAEADCDGASQSPDAALARAVEAAAVRELREEAGIELGADAELIPFARWITPVQLKRRFDAWFLVAAAPPGAEPIVDGAEIVEHRWYAPADALKDAQRDQIALVFPTIKQLERISVYASADELIAAARDTEVVVSQPTVVLSDGRAHVSLAERPPS